MKSNNSDALDGIVDQAAASVKSMRSLPLPTDKTGVAALRVCTNAAFALVEALLRLRELSAQSADGQKPLSPEETEDLLAGARRTLARTRPKDP